MRLWLSAPLTQAEPAMSGHEFGFHLSGAEVAHRKTWLSWATRCRIHLDSNQKKWRDLCHRKNSLLVPTDKNWREQTQLPGNLL